MEHTAILKENKIADRELQSESEKQVHSILSDINLEGGRWISEEKFPGMKANIRYYDLKNVLFISNTDIATLIELLKSLLVQGIEVQFLNASDKIKSKIKNLGLDHILICDEETKRK